MNAKPFNILLADDDTDDCLFFKEALAELTSDTNLTMVHDGEQLMQMITPDQVTLPHIIFLDINMPRKNGLECLKEIKLNPTLKAIPIIIFSTSFEQNVVRHLYDQGAQYFIRKPVELYEFKQIVKQTVHKLLVPKSRSQLSFENFVLTQQNSLII
jgi:CheY-like chemotaxis protein